MPRKKVEAPAPAPTPASEGGQATKEQILYAAAHLFRDQGYASTTLRQIADGTGIRAGSIYYYFPSKDDMLLEVLDMGMRMVSDAVKARVSSVGENLPARERIAAAIHGHLYGLLEHGDFTSANTRVYAQIPESLKRRHRPARRAYSRYWDRVLEEALRDGELRGDIPIAFLRPLVLGMLNWTVEWYDPAEHGTVEQFAERVIAVIFDGILLPKGAGDRSNGKR